MHLLRALCPGVWRHDFTPNTCGQPSDNSADAARPRARGHNIRVTLCFTAVNDNIKIVSWKHFPNGDVKEKHLRRQNKKKCLFLLKTFRLLL